MVNPKEPIPKKIDKEIITPHRLTVLILVKEFFKFRTSEFYMGLPKAKVRPKYIQDFCILILKLIQNPDISLMELKIVCDKYNVHKKLFNNFYEELDNLSVKGISFFLDVVDEIKKIISKDIDIVAKLNTVQINKTSAVGYYIRRFLLNFNKLNFSEVNSVLYAFKSYYDLYKKLSEAYPEAHLANSSKEFKDWNSDKEQWTRRQAELFIASQAALLSYNEGKALEPKKLQFYIRNLLKSNPDLAEAHFLSYLNYLRVEEYCGAIQSLHHCFDRMTISDTKNPEEKNKAYRFAALNLAVLHYQMGHREEAFASLKEAITMAQEANDNVCLQHALSWLYCLIDTNKDNLLEHSIFKSLDLNLMYTMSLGIQSFVQYAGVTSGNPKQIFETITKSDIVNCQESYGDLIAASYAHKASLWYFYGTTEMSSLWSQLLLHLNLETPILGKSYCGEPLCLAMCNLANYFTIQGEYSFAGCLLNLARDTFPNEPFSRPWILCKSLLVFQRAFHHSNWNEAEIAAHKMAVVDVYESKLRLTELSLYRKDYASAHRSTTDLLKNKLLRIDYQIRAMILLAEVQCNSSFPHSVPPGIISLLNSSIVYANDYHLTYLSAIVHVHLANVQLLMGMPAQALELLDTSLVYVLTHGGHYDRARALLLYVKCVVANSKEKNEEDRKNAIFEAAKELEEVKKSFQKVEAYTRVKDVLNLQAILYDEIGKNEERNKCALEFKFIEEEYPTLDESYLETFL